VQQRTVLTPDVLEAAGFDAGMPFEAFEAVGCSVLRDSGYRGRTGLYEVMAVDETIRDLAIRRASADEIRARALANGMRLLRDDGLRKVRLGAMSLAEVARVS